jgi:hypothetical protein
MVEREKRIESINECTQVIAFSGKIDAHPLESSCLSVLRRMISGGIWIELFKLCARLAFKIGFSTYLSLR